MDSTAPDHGWLRENFCWKIPEFYNIGTDVCEPRGQHPDRLALIIDEDGKTVRLSFDQLRRMSNRFANVLIGGGLERGDRVAVFLPPSVETPIAHIAAFKAGLVSVPLFSQLGAEGLEYRLSNCGARAIVTDEGGATKLNGIRGQLPNLKRIYVTGCGPAVEGDNRFDEVMENASEDFVPVLTRAEEMATMIFTSGTEGRPKGVLHAHRVLLGCLPGFELIHNSPAEGELFWTPADWSWIAGIFPALAAWHCGMPVLMHSASNFDPEEAMRLMSQYEVRHTGLGPTALRLMRLADVRHPGVRLRSMASGGEAVSPGIFDWVRSTFDVTLHEGYGQTECAPVVGNSRFCPVRPGSMGRVIVGHDVRIIDGAGRELDRGETGFIGIRTPDPGLFLCYWNDPVSTKAKFVADFLLTGDLACQDEQGYFWHLGRADDIIKSGGHRIGPGEIEHCISSHKAVSMAAVVGVPDPTAGQTVKAWIVLKPDYKPSETLAQEIRKFVQARLAPHQRPRQIVFVESLPLNDNGKVVRRELRARC